MLKADHTHRKRDNFLLLFPLRALHVTPLLRFVFSLVFPPLPPSFLRSGQQIWFVSAHLLFLVVRGKGGRGGGKAKKGGGEKRGECVLRDELNVAF
jgi:hypothetical protein